MREVISIPPPIFYLGWIIQLSPGGFYVYDRQDHNYEEAEPIRFSTLKKAVRYIDEKVSRGY